MYNLLTLIIIQVQYNMNVTYNLRDEHKHTNFMDKNNFKKPGANPKTNLVLKHADTHSLVLGMNK